MKKSILLISVLLLVFQSTVVGQQNKFTLGVELGPSRNYLYGGYFTTINGATDKPAYYFSSGLSLQYNLPRVFSFRTGLLYEEKGDVIRGNYFDLVNPGYTTYTYKCHLNYLTIPLLVRATFGKKISYFINAGGFASFLRNATAPAWVPGYFIPVSQPSMAFFHSVDYGLTLGIGLGVPVGPKMSLSLEARNNLGLSNVSTLRIFSDHPIRTGSTVLLLGISYKFGA